LKGLIYISVFCTSLFLMGFQNNMENSAQLDILPVIDLSPMEDVPVTAKSKEKNDPFFVKHKVNGKEVFIECIVQGITFRDNGANKGKIHLYVDGVKKEEISAAAFIVRGLPSGTHQIKLEVVQADDSQLQMTKEFYVTIP
jgi:hypothetical protein